MRIVKVRAVGSRPLMMQRPTLANPLNPLTKEFKALTSKRKKTDDDLVAIARQEFIAACYFENGEWYIPADYVFSGMIAAAKMNKLGMKVKESLIVMQDKFPFKFNHDNKTPQDLFDNHEQYVDMRSVVVNRARTNRCRPIFPEWQTEFSFAYDETQLQESELRTMLENFGRYKGMGTYRDKYGRFEIEILEEKKA